MSDQGPFVIYRWWDAEGRLLYLGMTNRQLDRPAEHLRTKAWVADAVAMTVEHLPLGWKRPQVRVYERNCIRAERPLHNTVHNRAVRSGPRSPAKRRRTRATPLARRLAVVAATALRATLWAGVALVVVDVVRLLA